MRRPGIGRMTAIALAFICAALCVQSARAQWSRFGLEDQMVASVKIHDGSLYACTANGLYVRELLGNVGVWQSLGLEDVLVQGVAVLNADTIIAGSPNPPVSIYRTVDGGSNWEDFTNNYGEGEFQPVFVMDQSPIDLTILFAAGTANIARSTDAGLNWTVLWSGMSGFSHFIKQSPDESSVIWAGGEGIIFDAWLAKSTDGGVSFDLLDVFDGGDNRCHDVACYPGNADTVWTSMEGRVRRSVDGGVTWKDQLVNGHYLYGIEIDPLRPSDLYTAGGNSGLPLTLFLSTDGGVSWDSSVASDPDNIWSFDMVSTSMPGRFDLYLGTNKGVFRYTVQKAGCCTGVVGDVNCSGSDAPSVADIGSIVDFLFMSGSPLCCLEEADANMSGTTTSPPLGPEDISVADIGSLIDNMFITGAPLPDCP